MQRITTNALMLALTAGTLAATAHAQIAFGPRTDLATASRPAGVAAGDFTGDGLMDLAVVVDGPDRVMVMVGDGLGGFVAGPVSLLGAGVGADMLIAQDLDADGDTDLVVILDNISTLRALINNGTGLFTTGTSAPTGVEPRWVASGNLNGAGGADFAVANRDDGTVSVILDLATAPTTTTFAAGTEPRAVALGDFDGDADMDMVVTSNDDRTIRLFTGNGLGGFAAGQVITTPAVRPEGVVVADFDGDGDMDFAATVDSFVDFYRNDAGVFTSAARVATGSADPSAIYAGNFVPGAGPSVVTVNNDGGSISVIENLGGMAFGAAQVLVTGIQPQFAAVADVDASGADDIAVTNRDSNTTSVFLNTAVVVEPCPADFDGDGTLTLFDFLEYQSAFARGEARADIDGDGTLTLFDFLAFQNLFVAGCP